MLIYHKDKIKVLGGLYDYIIMSKVHGFDLCARYQLRRLGIMGRGGVELTWVITVVGKIPGIRSWSGTRVSEFSGRFALAGTWFCAGWHCHLVRYRVDKGGAVGNTYDMGFVFQVGK
jgi:hypothetical protein